MRPNYKGECITRGCDNPRLKNVWYCEACCIEKWGAVPFDVHLLDVQPVECVITRHDGTPEDLPQRAQHTAQRLMNEYEALVALLRWEMENRHDSKES